jgi:DNA polymerase-3 subunit delta'
MRLEEAFGYVRHAIEGGRPSNAYFILGPTRGEGMGLAVKILQLLFCEAADKPCGVCDGCRHVLEHIVPDVFWIYPELKTRVIAVDAIREKIIAPVGLTSQAGGWKAGVIVGAERMMAPAANAFLKTLEEPPPKTLFLLLADTMHGMLPTVISRCERIALSEEAPFTEPWHGDALEILAGPLGRTALERFAVSSQLVAILGDMAKKAEEVIDAEYKAERDLVEEDEGEKNGKIAALYREYRRELLVTLAQWFRDLLVLRSGGDAALLKNAKYAGTLRERAARLTLAQAIYNVNAVEELAAKMELNIKEDSLLAWTMDRLNYGI